MTSIITYPLDVYIILVVLLVFIWMLVKLILKPLQNFIFVNKYKTYTDMLYWYLEKSFDIIYKNQIVTYTAEGIHPASSAMETAKRDFIKLSRELMGKSTVRIMVQFFGSEITLTNLSLVYFQERVDSDELMDVITKLKTDQYDSE
jgi:hypothetical protein